MADLRSMENDQYLVYANNPEDAIDLVREIAGRSGKVITDVSSVIAYDCEAYDVTIQVKDKRELI
jgi:hypothetical protein